MSKSPGAGGRHFSHHTQATRPTPRRKKPTKTKQKALADKLFAAKVRARGNCQGQGFGRVACNGNLQCAHIVSRRYLNTRWDDDNALALCAAHHLYGTHHPLEWEQWIDTFHSTTMPALKRRALSSVKVDYDEILARLKEE